MFFLQPKDAAFNVAGDEAVSDLLIEFRISTAGHGPVTFTEPHRTVRMRFLFFDPKTDQSMLAAVLLHAWLSCTKVKNVDEGFKRFESECKRLGFITRADLTAAIRTKKKRNSSERAPQRRTVVKLAEWEKSVAAEPDLSDKQRFDKVAKALGIRRQNKAARRAFKRLLQGHGKVAGQSNASLKKSR